MEDKPKPFTEEEKKNLKALSEFLSKLANEVL